jgi:nucleotide-binding universal stress UspA family protein
MPDRQSVRRACRPAPESMPFTQSDPTPSCARAGPQNWPPEARRAVSAALPFIGRADQVFVAAAGSDARFEGAEEVSELLCRHGAHITMNLLDAPGGAVADAVLRFAKREEADLIVMGGYGHSRLREWLFGGVTRDILRASPLCCLMSH